MRIGWLVCYNADFGHRSANTAQQEDTQPPSPLYRDMMRKELKGLKDSFGRNITGTQTRNQYADMIALGSGDCQ